MPVNTFTKSGSKSSSKVSLDKSVFGVDFKDHALLKAAYNSYLSNGRQNLASAKTRSLVRGGGKKPWRQKGTGRARAGSIRSPLWKGGGVIFGPTGIENYSKKLNKSAKSAAIKQALSVVNNSGKISVIEDFKPKGGKTSEAAGLLKKIGATRFTLIVVDKLEDEAARSVKNLKDVEIISANNLNVYKVLNADSIIFTNAALKIITDSFKVSTAGKPKGESK